MLTPTSERNAPGRTGLLIGEASLAIPGEAQPLPVEHRIERPGCADHRPSAICSVSRAEFSCDHVRPDKEISMTVNLKDPNELAGKPVLGTGDSKLGKVEEVCLDNETNKLEWASIKTGMFGGHVSLVPLANAEFDGSTLRVPYDKELLKAAPHTDPGQDLSPGSGTTIMCRMTPLSGNPIRTGLTGQDRQRAPLTCGPPERPSSCGTACQSPVSTARPMFRCGGLHTAPERRHVNVPIGNRGSCGLTVTEPLIAGPVDVANSPPPCASGVNSKGLQGR
jgi:sporulation protein YlmC with PRC-barrel domain